MTRIFALPLLSLALLLNGCGSDGSRPAAHGTLNVILTDAPACGYDHVYVSVERVRVHQSATAGANAPGWHELRLPDPQKIDLLALSNGVFLTLGQTPLPAGHYQQIRLVLAENAGGGQLRNSIVPTGGSEQELVTPSATQSGYKVIGNFSVQPNTLVDLVLDFDACRSVVQKGHGGYALKPVVKATPLLVSGIIDGYVSPADAGAFVFAEQAGVVIKGTVADSAGRFILSPVIQSTGKGTYDVVISRKGDTSVIVRGVPVAAAATTTISTASQPFLLPSSGTHRVSGTVSPAWAEASLEALQISAGHAYAISGSHANLDSGAYEMSLPVAAPLVGDFNGSLPVPLTADPLAAGQYFVRATTALGATRTTAIDILSGDAPGVDFLF
ncbi:MAG: DUF4382 domain-containing protein [Pseudomonadota bacterium]